MDKSKVNYDSDVLTLVKLVEERPCIWDKSCIKEPGERKRAWREICQHLQPRFDEMEPDEQTKFEHHLSGKWQNLRDTFTKMAKKQSERKYKYYECLKFILKNIDLDNKTPPPSVQSSPVRKLRKRTSSPNRRIKRFSSPSFRYSLARKRRSVSSVPTSVMPPPPPPLKAPKTEHSPDTSFTNNVKVLHHQKNKSVDEDEAFFMSIMTSVKKLSDEEKLEFRIAVLGTIREITVRSKMRNASSNPVCSGLLFVTQDEYSEDDGRDIINVTD